MKKYILLLFINAWIVNPINAQLLFSENFQATVFPTNFTLYDQDGNSVTTTSNFNLLFPNAWNRLGFTGSANTFAASTSAYSPAGTSDDWMITPSVSIVDNTILSWRALGGSATSPSDYEVKISTRSTSIGHFTTTLATYNDAPTTWTDYNLDLSAYKGRNVHIAFRNITNNGLYLAIDDIEIESFPDNDVIFNDLNIEGDIAENTSVNVEAEIRNGGADTLTSLVMHWSLNGGNAKRDTINGLSIAPLTVGTIIHDSVLIPSNAGSFSDLKVWSTYPNGGIDADLANDTIDFEIFINKGITVPKKALLEEYTTARCQFCPDGQLVVEDILANTSDVIAVGVHSCFNTDAMTTSEATDICNMLGNNQAPTAMVDRVKFEGETNVEFSRAPLGTNTESAWLTRARDRASEGSAANIVMSGTYDDFRRTVNVDVSTTLVDYIRPGSIRVSLMILEDSVSNNPSNGYDPTWDQVNAYYAVAGHPFNGVGTPFASPNQNISYINDYVHRHVLRDIRPSTWGDRFVIPSNPSLNTAYSTNFNFTLNSSWDDSKISLVAIVSYYGGSDETQYEVINAEQVKLSSAIAPKTQPDLQLLELNMPDTSYQDQFVYIEGKVKNVSQDIITEFRLDWSTDSGANVQEQRVRNIAILPDSTFSFSHFTPFYAALGDVTANFKVWISNPNNSIDTIVNNDTLRKSVYIVPNPLDIQLESITTPKIFSQDSTVVITGTIYNSSFELLEEADINYSIDGGQNIKTQRLSNLGIRPLESGNFQHDSVFIASNPNNFTSITAWISNPNNSVDTLNQNDSLEYDIFVNLGNTVQRNPLIELFTTADCASCPGDNIEVQNILDANEDAIAIEIHSCTGSDSLTTLKANSLCSTFGTSSSSSLAMIDRTVFQGTKAAFSSSSNNSWTDRVNDQLEEGAIVEVIINGSYDSTTRMVNVQAKANFVDYTAASRLNLSLLIVEDNIIGDGPGFDQANAYDNVSGHPYQGFGDPIIGFAHNNVLRDILPTTFGDNVFFPSQISLNSEYRRDFNFELNGNWKEDFVSVIVLVNENDPGSGFRRVLNAQKVKVKDLEFAVGIDELENQLINNFNVYPNPAKDQTQIQFKLLQNSNVSLSLKDVTGKQLLYKDYGQLPSGSQLLKLDVASLSNGFYYLTVNVNSESMVKKVMINQ